MEWRGIFGIYSSGAKSRQKTWNTPIGDYLGTQIFFSVVKINSISFQTNPCFHPCQLPLCSQPPEKHLPRWSWPNHHHSHSTSHLYCSAMSSTCLVPRLAATPGTPPLLVYRTGPNLWPGGLSLCQPHSKCFLFCDINPCLFPSFTRVFRPNIDPDMGQHFWLHTKLGLVQCCGARSQLDQEKNE